MQVGFRALVASYEINKIRLSFVFKMKISVKINRPNSELAVIYSSIGQTYQDLENYRKALEYFELELKINLMNPESVCEQRLPKILKKKNCYYKSIY